eukprot:TRINITY_DN2377_c0_g1_i1.p1 TRINITY_DN2377_c0_g1~~TRINITY_DN2377_c0_g1_i1.p1  ORF type:complete len:341 (-),score=91.44 TRINITY_DN2377_c0_g1_i1:744-1766(-)
MAAINNHKRLFSSTPVSEEAVRRAVADHWGLSLGACLKASQNHTFDAVRDCAYPRRFVVRVTPETDDESSRKRQEALDVEAAFLDYLERHSLPVCAPVPSRVTGKEVVRVPVAGDAAACLFICVFPYADGEPVLFQEYRWMTDREHVAGLGRWLGRLHCLSRQFAAEYPEVAARGRQWTQLHADLLADVSITNSPGEGVDVFGLIHGDVNPSNYFWDAAGGLPCMFDWDQLQRCWFMYDLAQPVWAVVMLAGAGSPLDGGKAVPEADPARYTDWLVEGYEQETKQWVDHGWLQQMVCLRRELYRRFCKLALHEVPADSVMGKFCAFITNWLETESKQQSQ